VTPGSQILSLTYSSLTLSATDSFDPDEPEGGGSWTYQWECKRERIDDPSVDVPECWTGQNENTATTTATLRFYTPDFDEHELDRITFTLTVTKDGRSAQASTSYTWVEPSVVAVELTPSSPGYTAHHLHNPSDPLSISTAVTNPNPAGGDIGYTWYTLEAEDRLAPLDSVAMVPLVLSALDSPTLELAADALEAGMSYTFYVDVSAPNVITGRVIYVLYYISYQGYVVGGYVNVDYYGVM